MIRQIGRKSAKRSEKCRQGVCADEKADERDEKDSGRWHFHRCMLGA